MFTRSPLRRVMVLSDGSSRACRAWTAARRETGPPATRRCPGRQDRHVADRHRIAAQAGAEADPDRQFLGPFQQRSAGDAFEPRLHLARDLAEVEAEKPRARLVDLERQLGRRRRNPGAHHGHRGDLGQPRAQVVARQPQRVDVLPHEPQLHRRIDRRALRQAADHEARLREGGRQIGLEVANSRSVAAGDAVRISACAKAGA